MMVCQAKVQNKLFYTAINLDQRVRKNHILRKVKRHRCRQEKHRQTDRLTRFNGKNMNYNPTFFFTADQHYDHVNIIKHCDRPFASVEEMDAEIIQRHNEMVGPKDVVVHAGDFTLSKKPFAENYIRQLNVTHIFLRGSHDYWLKKSATLIW